MIRAGLIGDYNPDVKAHRAIPEALRLAAGELGRTVEFDWIPTPDLQRDHERKLDRYQALWTVPASPYASMEGALNGIRFARERKVPFLGTCGGFQHMLLEYARNALGLAEADHAELNPAASLLLVTPLTCSVSEQTLVFKLVPGSKAAEAYGTGEVQEQYGTCNYGLNLEYAPLFERTELRVAGVDTDGEIRIMEHRDHPFYVGTLFQPERSAFRGRVHPLIRAYLEAASAVSS